MNPTPDPNFSWPTASKLSVRKLNINSCWCSETLTIVRRNSVSSNWHVRIEWGGLVFDVEVPFNRAICWNTILAVFTAYNLPRYMEPKAQVNASVHDGTTWLPHMNWKVTDIYSSRLCHFLRRDRSTGHIVNKKSLLFLLLFSLCIVAYFLRQKRNVGFSTSRHNSCQPCWHAHHIQCLYIHWSHHAH